MQLRGLPKFSGEKSGLLKPDFRKIKQFTRLTLVGDDQVDLNSGLIKSYDLLAVRPTANYEKAFNCDVDIISLDLSQRL